MKISLDIYGFKTTIQGPNCVIEKLARDFSFFRTKLDAEVNKKFIFILYDQKPVVDIIPKNISASYCHPNFVQYEKRGVKYTEYNESGISIYDQTRNQMFIYSNNLNFMHEISYLAVLSIAGNFIEKKGYYRIHSLAFAYKGEGVILLAPSGGGKTSLFFELIRDNNIKFFSDDIALIDRRGRILPFPLRIGTKKSHEILNKIDKKYLYGIKRRKYGKKNLIDSAAFENKISGPAEVKVILLGRRWNSEIFKFKPIGRLVLFCELFKNFIIGLGLPQILEYMNMQFKLKNFMIILKTAFKRTAVSLRLIFKCRPYMIYLGRKHAANRKGINRILDLNIKRDK